MNACSSSEAGLHVGYPIARAYADARIVKIAGGSIEIMKYIIGRSLFADKKEAARMAVA